MQCVGSLRRFHKNVKYDAGSGVVMSPGVYRRLTGKILAPIGAPKRLGLNSNMPLPFVVVVSGKTTTTLLGLAFINVRKSVVFAPAGGRS